MTLLESAEGWTLRGSVKMRAPITVAIDYWEARYDRNWRPLELTVNVNEDGVQRTLHTTFSGSIASIDVSKNGEVERRTANITAGCRRPSGSRFRRVRGAHSETFGFPARHAAARTHCGQRRHDYGEARDAGNRPDTWPDDLGPPLDAAPRWRSRPRSTWTSICGPKAAGLLRIDIPSRMLSVVRDDIAGVSARVVTMARPNDEQVSIPANGFSLAATISKPAAVSSDLRDERIRDGRSAIARGRSDIGLRAHRSRRDRLRYSHLCRACERVGGRRLSRRAIRRTRHRAERREAGERHPGGVRARRTGGRHISRASGRTSIRKGFRWSATAKAAGSRSSRLRREKRVAAVDTDRHACEHPARSLCSNSSGSMLEASGSTAADRQSAVERQKAIFAAVISGKGWENLTLDVRRRVDTPLYRSFLTFEPAQMLARVRQPMLVVQPMLDREVGVAPRRTVDADRSRATAGSDDRSRAAGGCEPRSFWHRLRRCERVRRSGQPNREPRRDP